LPGAQPILPVFAAAAQSDEAAVDAFTPAQKYTYWRCRVGGFLGRRDMGTRSVAGPDEFCSSKKVGSQKLKDAARTWTQNAIL